MMTTVVSWHLHHLTYHCFVIITFKIYSLGTFQGYNTLLLIVFTMLHIRSPEHFHLKWRDIRHRVQTIWVSFKQDSSPLWVPGNESSIYPTSLLLQLNVMDDSCKAPSMFMYSSISRCEWWNGVARLFSRHWGYSSEQPKQKSMP